MAEHNQLGQKGEELAAEFLAKSGYKILHKSWRFKHKEIDIIAKYENVIVFVEVKTRTDNYWGNPEDFVTKQKQAFLIAAADEYIVSQNFIGEARFDIISVIFTQNTHSIDHIIEAFYP